MRYAFMAFSAFVLVGDVAYGNAYSAAMLGFALGVYTGVTVMVGIIKKETGAK